MQNFADGAGVSPEVGAPTYYFHHSFPKTACNYQKNRPKGGGGLGSSNRSKSLVDLKGGEGRPSGSKFFQFHAVFGKIWQNRMLVPPGELAPPPMGNPGSVQFTFPCPSAAF